MESFMPPEPRTGTSGIGIALSRPHMHRTPHGSSSARDVADDVITTLALALQARRAAALIRYADGAECHAIASLGFSDDERQHLCRSLTIGDDPTRAGARAYWDRLAAAGRPLYVTPTAGDAAGVGQLVGDVLPHLATPLIASDGTLLGVIVIDATALRDDAGLLAEKMGRIAAVAIEQTRLAETRGSELMRSAVLFEIMREVHRPVELPAVLAAFCRQTAEAFGARQVTVYFHSRRHRGSLPIADYGTPPQVAERFVGARFLKGTVPHEDEVQAGQIVVIRRDQTTATDDLLLLDATEVEVLVFVPLREQDGTVRGLISVGFAEPREFAAAELDALETVGRHAAMAVERARFLDRLAKSAQFRAAVSALAIELNAATTRSETLQLLFTRGCEVFGVDSAALFAAAGDDLIATATHGTLASLGELVLPIAGDEPVPRAFRTREVVFENDRPRNDDAPLLDRMRSMLAIPLVDTHGSTGVIVFGALRPRVFRPHLVEEAPVLGALAGAVLRNLELMGQLHDTNQRLSRVSALKDQFLANVSHDLRTPLNVIIGFAQLALEDTFGEPPAELREILGRMQASARQQFTLVQDLLDVSRLELNGLTVKSVPTALAPLFADMEFLATSLVRQKPVRVAVEVPPDDVWVHADPDRLRQILTNLLANAAKFTDGGTIALRAVVTPERVRIDVTDSGIGIPETDLDAIFEPFRQVEGERAALGTGLGLAIAKRLATLMQGSLSVRSVLGRGSTFTVELAAVRPSAAAEGASTFHDATDATPALERVARA
ncbi:MAG: GAF domain-containing protein [Deltaproteobacteria bacterium]|nr:MAG: GAF domain-containing protein [Deltaproteobacteria bacterium]